MRVKGGRAAGPPQNYACALMGRVGPLPPRGHRHRSWIRNKTAAPSAWIRWNPIFQLQCVDTASTGPAWRSGVRPATRCAGKPAAGSVPGTTPQEAAAAQPRACARWWGCARARCAAWRAGLRGLHAVLYAGKAALWCLRGSSSQPHYRHYSQRRASTPRASTPRARVISHLRKHSFRVHLHGWCCFLMCGVGLSLCCNCCRTG